MLSATTQACENADVLLMTAAVADYRPERSSERKIKKAGGGLELCLVENPDVLASISRSGLLKVGFAAETDDLLANARKKLQSKGCDLLVANDATATIGSPDAALTLLHADGRTEELGLLPKDAAADRVVQAVISALAGATA